MEISSTRSNTVYTLTLSEPELLAVTKWLGKAGANSTYDIYSRIVDELWKNGKRWSDFSDSSYRVEIERL